MSAPTIHTERGDIVLTPDQMRLHRILATDRFTVFATRELCRALRLASSTMLEACAAALRGRFAQTTGLRLVQSVWGVGCRLEHLTLEQRWSPRQNRATRLGKSCREAPLRTPPQRSEVPRHRARRRPPWP